MIVSVELKLKDICACCTSVMCREAIILIFVLIRSITDNTGHQCITSE